MDIHEAQAETVELVEQHFPKGECAERGSANVLHAQMWVVFNKLLTTQREEIAREVIETYGDGSVNNPALVVIESNEGSVTQRPALDDILNIINKK